MNEEAILLVVTNEQDEEGFPVERTLEIPVFVKERSVRQTEFYEALRTGYKARIILEMRNEDWEQSRHRSADGHWEYATKVIYDDEVFEVLRTFKTSKAKIQVTLN